MHLELTIASEHTSLPKNARTSRQNAQSNRFGSSWACSDEFLVGFENAKLWSYSKSIITALLSVNSTEVAKSYAYFDAHSDLCDWAALSRE